MGGGGLGDSCDGILNIIFYDIKLITLLSLSAL